MICSNEHIQKNIDLILENVAAYANFKDIYTLASNYAITND